MLANPGDQSGQEAAKSSDTLSGPAILSLLESATLKSLVERIADERIAKDASKSKKTLQDRLKDYKTYLTGLFILGGLYGVISDNVLRPFIIQTIHQYVKTDERIHDVAERTAKEAVWQVFTATKFLGQYETVLNDDHCKTALSTSIARNGSVNISQVIRSCYSIRATKNTDFAFTLPFTADPGSIASIDIYVRQQRPILADCQSVDPTASASGSACISYDPIPDSDAKNLKLSLNNVPIQLGLMKGASPLDEESNDLFSHFEIEKQIENSPKRTMPVHSLRVEQQSSASQMTSSTIYVVIRVNKNKEES